VPGELDSACYSPPRSIKHLFDPKFEYGLAVSRFNSAETVILENLQDKCLRLFFGGHATASTTVYKHICNLPYMEERLDILRTKLCIRFNILPADCLIRLITPLLTASRIHYLRTNALHRSLPTPLLLNKLPDHITSYRLAQLRRRCNHLTRPPVLLRACRTQPADPMANGMASW
jgi:hypothetical protein